MNSIFMFSDDNFIRGVLLKNSFLNKFIVAGIGLIPSCYPSILFTQLYLDNILSLGALIAGTLSNAGLGMFVLYKVNNNPKETLRILGVLYAIGVIFGIITDIFA